MAAIKGGCMCGAVSYEVSGTPIFVAHCACENCQKATGSGHNTVAAFQETALKASGDLTSFAAKGDSGKNTTYQFCREMRIALVYPRGGAPERRDDRAGYYGGRLWPQTIDDDLRKAPP